MLRLLMVVDFLLGKQKRSDKTTRHSLEISVKDIYWAPRALIGQRILTFMCSRLTK